MHPARWRVLLAVLLAACAAFGVGVAVDDDRDSKPDRFLTKTTQVNQAPGDGAPTRTLEVPAAAVEAAKATEDNLRDETPPEAQAAAPEKLEAAQNAVEKVKQTKEPLPTAGASAGFKGCRTQFVRNQSSRRGVRPVLEVLHYTVSPNRPGWSDVNAIVAYFNFSTSQASSHFVIDREGHCAYIVPIEAKAWTQGAGNPIAVSYEIINSGRESSFMDTAGYGKLRSVSRQVRARTGIRARAGSVFPLRSGIVQHKDGGLAWGGHVDIGPFAKSPVIALMISGAPARKVTKPQRATCRKLRAYRRAGSPNGGRWERNSIRRRKALEARRVTCKGTRGPVTRR